MIHDPVPEYLSISKAILILNVFKI